MNPELQVETPDQIKAIEVNIEDARRTIDLADTLERLQKNPDFVKLIETEYLNQHALRLVYSKANPGMQGDQQQAAVIRSLDAVSELRSWFSFVMVAANTAEASIQDSERELEEMRNEDLHGSEGEVIN